MSTSLIDEMSKPGPRRRTALGSWCPEFPGDLQDAGRRAVRIIADSDRIRRKEHGAHG